MIIQIDSENNIILKKVYNGIGLESDDNEFFSICMRDSGFEFKYNNIWYEAKEGIIRSFNLYKDSEEGMCECHGKGYIGLMACPFCNSESFK